MCMSFEHIDDSRCVLRVVTRSDTEIQSGLSKCTVGWGHYGTRSVFVFDLSWTAAAFSSRGVITVNSNIEPPPLYRPGNKVWIFLWLKLYLGKDVTSLSSNCPNHEAALFLKLILCPTLKGIVSCLPKSKINWAASTGFDSLIQRHSFQAFLSEQTYMLTSCRLPFLTRDICIPSTSLDEGLISYGWNLLTAIGLCARIPKPQSCTATFVAPAIQTHSAKKLLCS
jgi:hypothetical protein